MSVVNREEVIDWCKETSVDFIVPYPEPPEGWVWMQAGMFLILEPLCSSYGDEITAIEVGLINSY